MKRWRGLAVMVAIGIAASLWFSTRAPIGTDLSGRQIVEDLLSDTASPSLGPADAKVVVVEFSDYRCPACRRAHPALHEAAQADGSVRIIYRDFPVFGDASERAARVALASDRQGIYPEVHDALMRHSGGFSDAELRAIVERAGGEWAQILAQRDDAITDFQLETTREDAYRLSVRGTPTYLIGPYRIVGALSESQFRNAFERARGR